MKDDDQDDTLSDGLKLLGSNKISQQFKKELETSYIVAQQLDEKAKSKSAAAA